MWEFTATPVFAAWQRWAGKSFPVGFDFGRYHTLLPTRFMNLFDPESRSPLLRGLVYNRFLHLPCQDGGKTGAQAMSFTIAKNTQAFTVPVFWIQGGRIEKVAGSFCPVSLEFLDDRIWIGWSILKRYDVTLDGPQRAIRINYPSTEMQPLAGGDLVMPKALLLRSLRCDVYGTGLSCVGRRATKRADAKFHLTDWDALSLTIHIPPGAINPFEPIHSKHWYSSPTVEISKDGEVRVRAKRDDQGAFKAVRTSNWPRLQMSFVARDLVDFQHE